MTQNIAFQRKQSCPMNSSVYLQGACRVVEIHQGARQVWGGHLAAGSPPAGQWELLGSPLEAARWPEVDA